MKLARELCETDRCGCLSVNPGSRDWRVERLARRSFDLWIRSSIVGLGVGDTVLTGAGE